MADLTVLLTGFEAFAESPENPSAHVVGAIDREPPAGFRLHARVLPVVVGAAPRVLGELLEAVQPDVVLALGEARGAAAVRIERLAANLVDFETPDNAGEVATDQPIASDGPAAYWTTLPVGRIQRAIRQRGIPCIRSLSAGSHLCNLVFYRALHWAATRAGNTRVGFIHLPSLPVQMVNDASPRASMGLSLQIEAVRVALDVIVNGDDRTDDEPPIGS